MRVKGPWKWTWHAIDNFVSPYVSKFTEAKISDRSALAERARTWASSFALRSIFVARPVGPVAQYGFLFVRRSAAAVGFCELARVATADFLAHRSDESPGLSRYATAADFWETFLSQAHQALTLISAVGKKEASCSQRVTGRLLSAYITCMTMQNPQTAEYNPGQPPQKPPSPFGWKTKVYAATTTT